MSRVDVARARELREHGVTLRAIAEEFGVTPERIRQLVGSPPCEKACEHCGCSFKSGRANKRFCSVDCRRAAGHGTCACGAATKRESTMCWNCQLAAREVARQERRQRIADLWDDGLPMAEIAAKVGFANANALGVALARMRNTGWDLQPRRAGWVGHTRPTGIPASPPETPDQARQQLTHAIANGRLRRPKRCERCARETFVDGHHSDYSKPFYVEWLCRTCHSAHHAQEKAA